MCPSGDSIGWDILKLKARLEAIGLCLALSLCPLHGGRRCLRVVTVVFGAV